LFAAVALMVALCVTGAAQAEPGPVCPVMPAGLLCISQAAGNRAGELVRENAALKSQVDTLKAAVDAGRQNEITLRESYAAAREKLLQGWTDTQVELGKKTGELIGKDAEITRCQANFELALKAARPKKNGLINF